MNKEKIGLYSGWGIEPRIRNPGDLLCHNSMFAMLKDKGYEAIDLRSSIKPIETSWTAPLVIGGGTVLPTVFEKWVGPGLKESKPIVIFGSGVLSPKELELKNIQSFDKNPYKQAKVVGVRGPLSAEYYHEYFGKWPNYVGDLAFYLTDTLKPTSGPELSTFFLIENQNTSSRISSDQVGILQIYYNLIDSNSFPGTKPTLTLTDYNSLPSHIKADKFSESVSVSQIDNYVGKISESQIVISERLHPVILAATYGIPFVYFQTTSKSKDLELLLKSQVNDSHFLDLMFVNTENPISLIEINDNCKILLTDISIKSQLIDVSRKIKKLLIEGSDEVVQLLNSH